MAARPPYSAYSFNARPGDQIEISLQGEGTLRGVLTDSEYRKLAGGSARFSYTFDPGSPPGTYYILVSEIHHRLASFTVDLERPSTTAATTADAAVAANTATPAYLSCTADTECVAVERAGCCHNGYKDAVNASQVEQYRAAQACPEGHHPCPLFRILDKRVAPVRYSAEALCDCSAGGSTSLKEMGQEIQCRMEYNGKQHRGKALLETQEIIFRGEVRLKIPFSGIREMSAQAGQLRIHFGEDTAVFELGTAAPKWVEKILHPPTRAAKFGLKSGSSFAAIGEVDADFLEEIQAAGAQQSKDAEVVLLAAPNPAALQKLPALRHKTVWIIYPKGIKTITEVDVIQAGRAAGLVDIKVVGFSKTHTALKFVAPRKKT